MAKDLEWDSVIAQADADDASVDLARAALLIAAVEYPDLDIDHELGLLDSLAAGAAHRLGDNRDTIFTLNTLGEYLFDEVGLQGNADDYYDPRNSHLNQVLKRQLGISTPMEYLWNFAISRATLVQKTMSICNNGSRCPLNGGWVTTTS